MGAKIHHQATVRAVRAFFSCDPTDCHYLRQMVKILYEADEAPIERRQLIIE